ncbi:MAG: ShlB/FhaC/HecB family hemolysin secretion/activation protein [Cyanobacteria bacterium SBLK]|nr:ShlB/FhaC/HecB family hemolysin secretion/activation protein [Cyanobacteria bacterium SBLK]
MISKSSSVPIALVLFSSLASPVLAEPTSFREIDLLVQSPQERTDPTNPDRDFLQPIDPVLPPEEEPDFFPDIEDSPPPDRNGEGISFEIDRIEVKGSTIFTSEDFAPILDPLQGQTIALGQLQEAVDGITQLYISKGYINSRAVLTEQTIANKTVTIEVIEGAIADIELNGVQRFQPVYFTSRLDRGIKTPFNINALEDQLRLLQINPLIEDLQVDLQPGKQAGESILRLDIEEAAPVFGTAFVDNYSSASVGSERYGLNLGYRNLLGLGDIFSATTTRSSTGGSRIYDFNYSIPINAMEGTLDVGIALDRNNVTLAPFDVLGIRGESETYSLSTRQPLIRNFTEEFALSVGLRHKTGQTFLFNNTGASFSTGAEADGTTRTMVLSFGQDYLKRDRDGAWIFRSQFNFGVDWWDATNNDDPTPDGQFFSWTGQVQRIHRLGKNHLFVIRGDVQLSPHNLLASESFGMGGGQTLRGYRQGARSGDNGWRISIEDRITVASGEPAVHLFQVIPFLDMGMVWNNPSNPDQIANEHFLAGLGVGLLYAPVENLTLRLDLTLPLVNVSDRSVNAQDDGIYFNLAYSF